MSEAPLIGLATTVLDGGVARNLLNLAGVFAASGLRVHVLVTDPAGPYASLLDRRVQLITVPTYHVVGGVPWMARYLHRYRPRALLAPNDRLMRTPLRARVVARVRTAVYVNLHNTYSESLEELTARKRRRRLARIRRDYPRADGIIPVSEGVAEDFVRVTGIERRHMTVIYNPVVTAELEALAAEEVDHPWFRDERIPVIVNVGRLEPQKNLTLLIDAFRLLRARLAARLAIVGDGSLAGSLRDYARAGPWAEEIAFLGHRSNPFPYMARAGVFALSSHYEGFGNVLVEAMATGTPVVSTDCPHGPREILADGAYGRLVPVRDAPALALALEQTLRDPLAPQTLKAATDRFRDRSIAAQYLRVFGLDATSEPDFTAAID